MRDLGERCTRKTKEGSRYCTDHKNRTVSGEYLLKMMKEEYEKIGYCHVCAWAVAYRHGYLGETWRDKDRCVFGGKPKELCTRGHLDFQRKSKRE